MTHLSEVHDGHKDLSENPEQRCYVLFYSWASQEAAAVGPTLRCLSKHERVGEVSVSAGG